MKLDATLLRYLTADAFRVLTAVEMGMKNHELVPTTLIITISGLGRGLAFKELRNLHKNKLVYHEAKCYDGYRLTYQGYDYLALKTFVSRGTITGIGKKIGVGKEADIYVVVDAENNVRCLKLHRLGRVSFRQIKNKRDYLHHRQNVSWFYLSRLASMKEFAFMKVLHEHGFPVPAPIDHNRHAVIMDLVAGYPMTNVETITNADTVYEVLMNIIVKLARHGLIHCDFNEFNLMIDDEEKVTMIDFPQMAYWFSYFDRDVECIRLLFEKKYGYTCNLIPKLKDYINEREEDLDVEASASGFFTAKQRQQLETFMEEERQREDSDEEDDEEGDAVDEDEEVEVGEEVAELPEDESPLELEEISDEEAEKVLPVLDFEAKEWTLEEEEEEPITTAPTQDQSPSSAETDVVQELDPVAQARAILMKERMENMQCATVGEQELARIVPLHGTPTVAVAEVEEEEAEKAEKKKKKKKAKSTVSRRTRTKAGSTIMTEVDEEEIKQRVKRKLARKNRKAPPKMNTQKAKNKIRIKNNEQW